MFNDEFKEWLRDIFDESTVLTCPQCGKRMTIHFGLSDNDKFYWTCPECNASVTVRDIFDGYANEYEDFYEE